MPTGGQLIYGSGIRLQGTSPGSSDLGNARISGTFVADRGVTSTGGIVLSGAGFVVGGTETPSVVGLTNIFTTNGGGANTFVRTVVVGENNTMVAMGNGGSVTGTMVGNRSFMYGGAGAVVIGNGAQVGLPGPTIHSATGIAIGASALVEGPTVGAGGTSYGVAIGTGARVKGGETSGIVGSVVIGRSSTYIPAAATKGNVIIGDGLSVGDAGNRVDNAIVIDINGTGTVNYNTDSNTVRLGNISHTKVILAGFTFQGGLGGKFWVQQANVTIGNTVVESTLFDAGLGSLQIDGNTVKVGQVFELDGILTTSGLGAGNTLTIKGKHNGTQFSGGPSITFGGATVNADVKISAKLVVRSIGAGGTAHWRIFATWGDPTTGAASQVSSGGTGTVAVDWTVNQVLDLTGVWNVANAANTTTSQDFDWQTR